MPLLLTRWHEIINKILANPMIRLNTVKNMMRSMRKAPPSSTSLSILHPMSALIGEWFEANYWTPRHFSLLTRGICNPEDILSPGEVRLMLKPVVLSPKHFRALASIYEYLINNRGKKINSFFEVYSIFASLPALNSDACKASWWFGVYCAEDWAIETVQHFQSPLMTLMSLGGQIPAFARKLISAQGLDPVGFIDEYMTRIKASYMPRSCKGFGDWLLGYKNPSPEETRVYLAVTISMISELEAEYHTISQFVDDLANNKRRPALKASPDESVDNLHAPVQNLLLER